MLISYLPLATLARRLNLPESYLRKLAEAGDLPYLRVGGRMRFSEDLVRDTLDRLSQERGPSWKP